MLFIHTDRIRVWKCCDRRRERKKERQGEIERNERGDLHFCILCRFFIIFLFKNRHINEIVSSRFFLLLLFKSKFVLRLSTTKFSVCMRYVRNEGSLIILINQAFYKHLKYIETLYRFRKKICKQCHGLLRYNFTFTNIDHHIQLTNTYWPWLAMYFLLSLRPWK